MLFFGLLPLNLAVPCDQSAYAIVGHTVNDNVHIARIAISNFFITEDFKSFPKFSNNYIPHK